MPNNILVNGGLLNGLAEGTPEQATANHGINTNNINTNSINGVVRLEYSVGESLIALAQEVLYSENGSGSLITIEQEVRNSGSGSLIVLTQMVRDTSVPSFYDRNGWDAHLYIDGVRIPANQIHGNITVVRTENDAAQMTFGLLPPRGPLDLTAYEGKSVILNVETLLGIRRVYTGKINIPDLDLSTRKLTITCTDNRRELINANPPLVKSIGIYSEDVFGVAKDLAQELDYRLTTVPYTVNFNPYGVPVVSYIFANPVTYQTFTENQVFRDNGRDPHVILTPRSKVVNTVNINVEYRYQRLFRTTCNYRWGNPINCTFLTYGYSLCRRDVIQGAAQSCGWPVVGSIDIGAEDSKGWYNCGDVNGDEHVIGFSWVEYATTNVASTQSVRQADGTLQNQNVVDAQGNQVYQAVATSANNYQQMYATGATWTCAYKWSQAISETYTCSVTAPNSVARFGTVSQDDSVGITSKYDNTKWVDNSKAKTLETLPAGFSAVGSPTVFYANETSNYADYANAMYTLLNKAKTTILKSHRQNYVTFNTFLNAFVDLSHTVLLDAEATTGEEIYAKGKVYQIVHTMVPSEGECNTEITLALSVAASGAQTDTPLTLPTRPSSNLAAPQYNILLQTYMGVDPDGPFGIDKAGFFGNRYRTAPTPDGNGGWTTNTFRTQFAEQFRVDTPEVERAYTDNVELTGSGSYSVAIIDDDLEVIN